MSTLAETRKRVLEILDGADTTAAEEAEWARAQNEPPRNVSRTFSLYVFKIGLILGVPFVPFEDEPDSSD